MPTTSQPASRARLTTALIHGLRPGTSPPPVRMPIRIGTPLGIGEYCGSATALATGTTACGWILYYRLGCSSPFQAAQVARELEAVLQQRQIGHKPRRPFGFDLGDQRSQLIRRERLVEGSHKVVERLHRDGAWDSGRPRDAGEIAASGRGGREAANGQQAFVVEHHV